MPVNPALRSEQLNNPMQRASKINDPEFSNQQGYFPYDLTHSEFITPRFGEVTPSMHLDTVPADRFVVHHNAKTVLNQIDGNLLSTVNQYVDSFYVPFRSVFPYNFEKLIPNPTKGDDLPNSALPQVPFGYLINDFLFSEDLYTLYFGEGNSMKFQLGLPSEINFADYAGNARFPELQFYIARLTLLATILSRGQLLDYFGVQFDFSQENFFEVNSVLQSAIDQFFYELYHNLYSQDESSIFGYPLSLTDDAFYLSTSSPTYSTSVSNLSTFRQAISDILERGDLVWFTLDTGSSNLDEAYANLVGVLREIFGKFSSISISEIDNSTNPFQSGFLNIGKILAYQQCIAHYYVNNSVDNIFTSELFMQNLRSIMFPSVNGLSTEPTFDYNGVSTEYDLISSGAWIRSLLDSNHRGYMNRQYVYLTVMFLMRRSLRYGDYFATARPRMLAVGQLSISVADGAVSPIDVTQNLLKQRYLNAANYIGSGILQWYASMYGVTPSDTGTFPRFLAHRKIELQNQITNNTAQDQGAQTTNLVGYSDNNAFDVFIDDFGYILSVVSYDVLPVYCSGIDSTYRLADRFDFFNSMMQNIGDEPILIEELYGDIGNDDAVSVFGYTMRDSKYKFKKSRAHGAFVNSLPGFLFKYPYGLISNEVSLYEYYGISPEFIRDKPIYMDSLVPKMTGISPASYFHFVVSVVNQVHAARKIQATPPVLF